MQQPVAADTIKSNNPHSRCSSTSTSSKYSTSKHKGKKHEKHQKTAVVAAPSAAPTLRNGKKSGNTNVQPSITIVEGQAPHFLPPVDRTKTSHTGIRVTPTVSKLQIDNGITGEMLDELKSTFKVFDKNGDGTITDDEISDLFQAAGYNASPSELADIVTQIDTSKSGTIEFNEFVAFMSRMLIKKKPQVVQPVKHQSHKETQKNKTRTKRVSIKSDVQQLREDEFLQVKAAFDELDADGSGELSWPEIKAAGEHIAGRPFDHTTFRKWDRDRSGYVSLLEMLREWYPSCKRKDLQELISKYSNKGAARKAVISEEWCEAFAPDSLDEVCDIFDLHYKTGITVELLKPLVKTSVLSDPELQEFYHITLHQMQQQEYSILDIIRFLYTPPDVLAKGPDKVLSTIQPPKII